MPSFTHSSPPSEHQYSVRYANDAQLAFDRTAEEYGAHVDDGNHGQKSIADDLLCTEQKSCISLTVLVLQSFCFQLDCGELLARDCFSPAFQHYE
jgi:hypothetical protein